MKASVPATNRTSAMLDDTECVLSDDQSIRTFGSGGSHLTYDRDLPLLGPFLSSSVPSFFRPQAEDVAELELIGGEYRTGPGHHGIALHATSFLCPSRR